MIGISFVRIAPTIQNHETPKMQRQIVRSVFASRRTSNVSRQRFHPIGTPGEAVAVKGMAKADTTPMQARRSPSAATIAVPSCTATSAPPRIVPSRIEMNVVAST